MKHIWVIIIVILSATTTFAQDGRENLLELLNTVPDQPQYRESLISYVDYFATVEAREGAIIPESWTGLVGTEPPPHQLYMAAIHGLVGGPTFFIHIYAGGKLWRETVGFDFVDIERGITFGTPPDFGNVIIGNFDHDAIAAALSTQNYISSELSDFVQWCGTIGCENGLLVDVQERNIGNPFGGYIGRQEPLLVSDRMIVNSPALHVIMMVEDAVTDKVNSLADNANYVAAVNSITPDNLLIQAHFVHPSVFLLDVANLFLDQDTDKVEALIANMADLPQYDLVMIADTATGSEQVVILTLVYPSLADAEVAVDVVSTRLENADSFYFEQPLHELFESLNITDMVATAIQDDEHDLAVAVFEFHAPLVNSIVVEGEEVFPLSSPVFRLFISMIYTRDMVWLATELP